MSETSRTSFVRGLRHVAGALFVLLLLAQVTPGAAGPQQTKKELEQARDEARELTRDLRQARA